MINKRLKELLPGRSRPKAAQPEAQPHYRRGDLAIIGIACRFPGAENAAAFWQNLVRGADSIREVPPTRWDWRAHYGDPVREANRTQVKRCGFIDDIDAFDEILFKLSPREVEFMDPQQRMLLETSWTAIEDAGYRVSGLSEIKTGVFIGIASHDYALEYASALDDNSMDVDPYAVTGMAASIAANRISYLLNLHGPSESVDTACSSSLVALHRARTAIRGGECEMALVGGVNALLHPRLVVSFDKARMLSEDGACKTFDAAANGFVRGEGVGVVLVKDAEKALADGDYIYGVVRGSAVNHVGRALTITSPSAFAQSQVISDAVLDSGVPPDTITYIETHGTGTPKGDPIEMVGLRRAFSRLSAGSAPPPEASSCGLGAVKTNIGHLEAAAGMAGLIKVLLCMQHGILPANLHFKELNPRIDLSGTRFYVIDELRQWPRLKQAEGEVPHRAGVSSFGFGGTNAHVVLEEPAEEARELADPESEGRMALLPLSAQSSEQLRQAVEALHLYLTETERRVAVRRPLRLHDLAYTLQTGRESFAERVAFLASSLDGLAAMLRRFLAGEQDAGHIIAGRAGAASTLPLPEGAEREMLIADFLAQRRLATVAAMWVLGVDINWSPLYENTGVRRVPLPTYPFARNRHWLPRSRVPAAAGRLHPLIDSNESGLDGVRYRKRVGPEDDFVRDHVVAGKKLVPATAYLEMARAAAGFANRQGQPFALRQVAWTAPLSLLDDPRTLEIRLTAESTGARFAIVTEHEHAAITHAHGQVGFGAAEEPDNPAAVGAAFDPAAVKARCSQQWNRETCYRMLQERGVLYGPGFRVVIELWANDREALARLDLPADRAAPEPNVALHPVLLDGALQTVIGLAQAAPADRVYVPVELAELRIFRPLTGPCYAHATVSDNGSPGPDALLAKSAGQPGGDLAGVDIAICDEQGRPLVAMRGLRFSAIRTAPTAQEQDEPPRALPAAGPLPATLSPARMQERLELYLATVLSRITKVPLDRFGATDSFENYGIDSGLIVAVNMQLERDFGELSATLLFEYRNLRELAEYFIKYHGDRVAAVLGQQTAAANATDLPAMTIAPAVPSDTGAASEPLAIKADANSAPVHAPADSAQPVRRRPPAHSDVAIIGISGRYPLAPDLNAFWKNLQDGRDCITEIPRDRPGYRRHAGNRGVRSDTIYCQWGGFIEGVDEFDSLLFNVSPIEAAMMDPQERLFLQTAWATLEDAGYGRHSLAGMPVGVYVGVMWGEYHLFGVEPSLRADQPTPSSSYASIANHVSYFFDFRGPSLAIDTMCSSSLSAIHLACQALQLGECRAAIAGGVNVSIHENKYLQLCQMRFAAHEGRCRSFGQGGDGYVPGEGVGAVLLKPLQDAVADGDHIYAVIKGTALNHGGKAIGYTVPRPGAQAEVIEAALQRAGVDARTISYVEAHGTGTALGDPIEMAGLAQAFRLDPARDIPCAIGSVKSNIGHAESAAGIAGVTKVVLQMQHRQLAPSIHSDPPNSSIKWETLPFRVQKALEPWPQRELDEEGTRWRLPRRAGVSSFGAGGSNAHVILEEYEGIQEPPVAQTGLAETGPETTESPALIVLSARKTEQLHLLAERLAAGLDPAPGSLSDIAYTLQVGRTALEERVAFVARSIRELRSRLIQFAETPEPMASHGEQAAGGFYRGRGQAHRIGSGDADERSARVRRALALRDLDELARAWVEGNDVDWRALYAGQPRGRVALPTYPFARDRHWVKLDAQSPREEAAAIHPLLDGLAPSRSLQQGLVYHTTVRRSDALVDQHRVLGRPVVPGAATLEMALAAAHSCRPNGQFKLADAVWLQPATVEQESETLYTRVHEDGASLQVEVTSGAGDRETRHMRCRAVADVAQTGEARSRIEIEAIRRACPAEIDREALYRQFDRVGLAYGENFRSLARVWAGDQEALGQYTIAEAVAADLSAYRLFPIALDAALQTLAGLFRTQRALRVPFAVAEVEWLQPIQPRGYTYVQRTGPDLFDATLLDEEGQVCVRLGGIAVRAMAAAREDFFYLPRWVALRDGQPAPATDAPHAERPAMRAEPRRVLIVYSGEEPARALALAAAHSGDAVEMVCLGNAERSRGPGHWEIVATDPRGLAGWVETMCRQQQAAAEAHTRGRWHTVYFLAVAEGLPRDLSAETIEVSQQRGVLSLFRLLKALGDVMPARAPLEFNIVTGDVISLGPDEPVDLHGAGMHGLMRSAAREYPFWRVRCFDVRLITRRATAAATEQESAARWQEAAALIAARPAAADTTGTLLLLRENTFYSLQVNRARLPEATGSPFRQGGVYMILGGAGGIGLTLARHLVETVQARVILLGRRPLDGSRQQQVDQLQAQGGQVLYLQADATDLQSLRRAIQEARSVFGPIQGVVHSALVLEDVRIEKMDERAFRSAWDPKALGSLNLYQAVAGEPLDFFLFFSSAQSFWGNVGQGNYAAGCSFQDAFAAALSQTAPYPVKVINWGYWGSVGAVAGPAYQRRMAAQGLQSIEPEEGMDAIERFLVTAPELTQIIALNAEDWLLKRVVADPTVSIQVAAQNRPSRMAGAIASAAPAASDEPILSRYRAALAGLEAFAVQTVPAIFCDLAAIAPGPTTVAPAQTAALAPGSTLPSPSTLPTAHRRLFAALVGVLLRAGSVRTTGGVPVVAEAGLHARWSDLARAKDDLLARYPELEAYVELLWRCVQALPRILTGEIAATEVLFAQGSLALVEKVYRGNPVSDYLNRLLAGAVRGDVAARLADLPSTEKLGILEIGAGTGGTTESVLSALEEFPGRVAYTYTDLSGAFTQHGASRFSARYPFVEFRQLDIERSVVEQGYEPHGYELVIAGNVLHATRNIRETLQNAKSLLKHHGLLILNEGVEWTCSATLTFGLLDGWWRAEDSSERLPDSPLLSEPMWQRVLTEEGLAPVRTLGAPSDDTALPQRVFVAESNGIVLTRGHTRAGVSMQPVIAAPTPGATRAPHPAEAGPEPLIQAPGAVPLPVSEPAHHNGTHAGVDSGEPGSEELRQAVLDAVLDLVSEVLQIDRRELDPHAPYSEYGVDSILGIQLIDRLNERLGINLRAIDLFSYSSADKLVEHIIADHRPHLADRVRATPRDADTAALPLRGPLTPTAEPLKIDRPLPQEKTAEAAAPDRDAIAVIGMSGRFPGAENVEAFWENLAAGRDAIREIPPDRWDVTAHFDLDPQTPWKTYSKWGGFLDDITSFDPLFFNISPREAEVMDPQQRLFLQEAWRALEDAGHSGRMLEGKRCGVFVGCGPGDYHNRLHFRSGVAEAYAFMGNSNSILAARIAYLLNLKGPAVPVDTACSSSLVAIALACDSIRAGNCEMALAGGVAVLSEPDFHILASKAGMLSPTGRCHTFDNTADGFVPGEAVGALVLKPLSAALADGDPIHGIIRGYGTNQDGHTNGITAPSAISQQELVREVYERFSIHPETISYVEAHGTGTKLGDPIEIEALTQAFRRYTTRRTYCAIGSVKTNIGHTLTAAGMAGVIKVLLAFRHGRLPPSLHFTEPNEHIAFDESPFYVNTQLQEWPVDGTGARRAAVSSFGFSGTNGHCVLESFDQGEPGRIERKHPAHLIVVSARTEEALRQKYRDLAGWVAQAIGHPASTDGSHSVRIEDVAYTLLVGRTHFNLRAAWVVRDLEELRETLIALQHGSPPPTYMQRNLLDLDGKPSPALRELGKRLLEEIAAAPETGRDTPGTAWNDRLTALADLYASGYELDWGRLYDGCGCRRLSLPTYPFARERHWIERAAESRRGDDLHLPAMSSPARAAAGAEPAPEARPSAAAGDILCFQPTWVAAAASEAVRAPDAAAGPVVVFVTDDEMGSAVRQRLQAMYGAGCFVTTVEAGTGYEQIDEDHYTINPAAATDVDTLLHMLIRQGRMPRKVLYLWALAEEAEQWPLARGLENSIYAVLALTQALMQRKPVHPVELLFAYRETDSDVTPAYTALAALFRTIRLEHPGFCYRTLLLSRAAEPGGGLAALWEPLAQELSVANWQTAAPEVRYTDAARWERQYEGTTLPGIGDADGGASSLQASPTAKLREGGVYLISGGAGGIGLLLAEHLVRRVRARVVLVGRSALTAPKQAALAALAGSGGEVVYEQCDVADEDAVRGMVAATRARFGHIHGVIHAAGSTRDEFVLRTRRQDVEAVLAPKVSGVIHLDRATQDEPLDFFLMFSSLAAVLGNVGQAGYAYANRYVAEYAGRRARLAAQGQRSGVTVAVSWPYWQAGGLQMTADVQQRLAEQFGLVAMPTAVGLRILDASIGSGSPHLVIAYGHEIRLTELLKSPAPPPELPPSIGTAAPDRAALLVETQNYIKRLMSEYLKVPPERIHPRADFTQYGVDSIIVTRFNVEMERVFGALPKTLLFEYQNVGELSRYLVDHHPQQLARYFRAADMTPEPAADMRGPAGATPPLQQSAPDGTGTTETETPGRAEPVRPEVTPSPAPTDNGGREDEPIAIVGVSGRYPGAPDLAAFWENLQAGRDAITEIPPERWDKDVYYDPDPHKASEGKIYCKWGGFLEDADKFDPLFFNMSPREAELMDPQERLFLQVAWAALEDAGYTRSALARDYDSNVGVFVGVTSNTYMLWGPDEWRNGNPVVPTSLPWSIANRVSYYFDFNGPSMPVDTACSSSLTAIHMACESLHRGECRLAIAGGVNLILHPAKYLGMCQMHMLSPTGRCHSFGQDGDGFVPGEGVGAVLLKPLSRAQADGDTIYAVVRGSAINHGGKTNAYTVPDPRAQAALVETALRRAGVEPHTLGYIEAHGTGTILGDPIEIRGLRLAFGAEKGDRAANGGPERPVPTCALGSLKSNIGHLEAAAGIAGVTKILYQMRYRQLVPTLHADPPNPNLDLEGSPFYLVHRLQDWEPVQGQPGAAPTHPRRAGISSFGAGGANAHIVLEEPPAGAQNAAPNPAREPEREEAHLIALSARNPQKLVARARSLLTFLEARPADADTARDAFAAAFTVANIAYTLQVGREAMEARMATVVSSLPELIARLRAFADGDAGNGRTTGPTGIYVGTVEPGEMHAASTAGHGDAVQGQASLEELAQEWVSGGDVDWKVLHRHAARTRVPLPTYPFARRRCWFTSAANRNTAAAKLAAQMEQAEMPARRQERRPDASANAEGWESGEITTGEISDPRWEMEYGEI